MLTVHCSHHRHWDRESSSAALSAKTDINDCIVSFQPFMIALINILSYLIWRAAPHTEKLVCVLAVMMCRSSWVDDEVREFQTDVQTDVQCVALRQFPLARETAISPVRPPKFYRATCVWWRLCVYVCVKSKWTNHTHHRRRRRGQRALAPQKKNSGKNIFRAKIM